MAADIRVGVCALQDRNDAQDVTQETFLRALRHLDQFQQRGIPFHAYPAAITRNLIRDGWRRPTSATIPLQDVEQHEPKASKDDVASEDERIFLRHVMAQLPVDYQTVIRLRILEGRPTDEVATFMQRSPGAVRVLQHRAVLALRAQLNKES